jgi:hypothetical protein
MAGDIKLSSPTTSVVELGKDSGKPVTTQPPSGPGRRNSVSASGVPGLASRVPAHTRSSSMSSTGTSVDSSATTLPSANLSRTNSDLSTASTATSYTKDGALQIPRKPVPDSATALGASASDRKKPESQTVSIAGDLAGIPAKSQLKDMPHSTPSAGDLETRDHTGKSPGDDDVDNVISQMNISAKNNMKIQVASQKIQSDLAAMSAANELHKALIQAAKDAAKDASEAGKKPS